MLLALIAGGTCGLIMVGILSIVDVLNELSYQAHDENYQLIRWFLVSGVVLITLMVMGNYSIHLPEWTLIPVGILSGGYIGIFIGSLAEVLGMIPFIVNKFLTKSNFKGLIYAIVGGKTFGSLVYWLCMIFF